MSNQKERQGGRAPETRHHHQVTRTLTHAPDVEPSENKRNKMKRIMLLIGSSYMHSRLLNVLRKIFYAIVKLVQMYSVKRGTLKRDGMLYTREMLRHRGFLKPRFQYDTHRCSALFRAFIFHCHKFGNVPGAISHHRGSSELLDG